MWSKMCTVECRYKENLKIMLYMDIFNANKILSFCYYNCPSCRERSVLEDPRVSRETSGRLGSRVCPAFPEVPDSGVPRERQASQVVIQFITGIFFRTDSSLTTYMDRKCCITGMINSTFYLADKSSGYGSGSWYL
jgi:hypothetical protein